MKNEQQSGYARTMTMAEPVQMNQRRNGNQSQLLAKEQYQLSCRADLWPYEVKRRMTKRELYSVATDLLRVVVMYRHQICALVAQAGGPGVAHDLDPVSAQTPLLDFIVAGKQAIELQARARSRKPKHRRKRR